MSWVILFEIFPNRSFSMCFEYFVINNERVENFDSVIYWTMCGRHLLMSFETKCMQNAHANSSYRRNIYYF